MTLVAAAAAFLGAACVSRRLPRPAPSLAFAQRATRACIFIGISIQLQAHPRPSASLIAQLPILKLSTTPLVGSACISALTAKHTASPATLIHVTLMKLLPKEDAAMSLKVSQQQMTPLVRDKEHVTALVIV